MAAQINLILISYDEMKSFLSSFDNKSGKETNSNPDKRVKGLIELEELPDSKYSMGCEFGDIYNTKVLELNSSYLQKIVDLLEITDGQYCSACGTLNINYRPLHACLNCTTANLMNIELKNI